MMSASRCGQRSRRRSKGSRLKGATPPNDVEISSEMEANSILSEQPFSPLRQRRLSGAALLRGYEEEDSDDTSIDSLSSYPRNVLLSPTKQHHNPRQLSTTELLEESHLQVGFCEMTVAEMNQILDWWSSKPASLADDNENVGPTMASDCQAPQNSLTLPDNQDDEELEDDLLVFDTPSKSTVALGVWDNITPTSFVEDNYDGSPSNLLIEQPLPQNVAFFSPIQSCSFQSPTKTRNDNHVKSAMPLLESPANLDHSFGAHLNDVEDVHLSAQKQHAEVTRLLFQTQDMVDMVASLTETSGTDEDNDRNPNDDGDDDDSLGTSSFQDQTMRPSQLYPPRNARSVLRRRTRGKKAENTAIQSSNSQDSNSSLLQLHLQDHCYLWFKRLLMKLETTIVSRGLVPVLPLPFLLYLMHRPRVFRCLLWAALFIQMISVPLLTWCCFPRRMVGTIGVQPALDLFLQHPYYMSELHYALQVIHNPHDANTAISFDEHLFCEAGGLDQVLL